MSHQISFLVLLIIVLTSSLIRAELNETHFFAEMKKSLTGSMFYEWDPVNTHWCNLLGVTCNGHNKVTELDFTGWSLSGRFPPEVCKYLPEMRVLRLGKNRLSGEFPAGIENCSQLEELDLNHLFLGGTLPELSKMGSLRVLDLSYNAFVGKFPISSVVNLTRLEILNFNENGGFDTWRIPDEITGLTRLRFMLIMTCSIYGPIPRSLGNMTELVDLELSGNFLSGEIPPELGHLRNLRQLELYYNQLSGRIPPELGNLTELVDLDISVNRLTGPIPESVCRLPKIRVIQFYNNSLTGEIPAAIEQSTSLEILSLYDNYLTGHVPSGLGARSPMDVFDLSENNLSGPLPEQVCGGGKLKYYLLLDNSFSGEIPAIYGECRTLLRFRVSNNRLQGPVTEVLLTLPHVFILDFAYNNLTGPIRESIAAARNLSEFFVQNNAISGTLPLGITQARNLVKIDVSNNRISGPIPPDIGRLRRLNLLLLQGNRLSSSIPASLSNLTLLNVLDLSDNLLTGEIPESLGALMPNSINFSNNLLSGRIPDSLVKSGLTESFSGNPNLCVETLTRTETEPKKRIFPACPGGLKTSTMRQKTSAANSIWAAAASLAVVLVGAVLFFRRRMGRDRKVTEQEEKSGGASSWSSYEVRSFHRIGFDQKEILSAAMDEKNMVGRGGSGTVHRVELKSKDVVAVKRLFRRQQRGDDVMVVDRELRTEVETLGSIRHKNIVKLYYYLASVECNLLVYEYMPNGNLWEAIHVGCLDWATRHGVALGIAQGLAYLHHDLLRPIIHRDIKSTNILLDVNYEPKVADFGIAKVLQARAGKDSATTTVVAGTYGYLAPEYAYSSKPTTKCDVYSFGVVLMELITGKRPVEPEFGENKNIIYWVSNKVDTKEGAMEVLDKRICGSHKDDMIQTLRVAIRCTYKNPALRPTMKEAVQLLQDVRPKTTTNNNK